MWFCCIVNDFYLLVFVYFGEQEVFNKEIFFDGSVNDDLVFGYQERWFEYCYGVFYVIG